MREIKFRAWGKENKRMIVDCEIWFKNGTFYIDYEEDAWPDGSGHWDNDGGNSILMQYTGLKDINGKEVYEKDVLGLGKYRGQVEFRNGSYWINWTDNTSTKLYAEIQGSKVIGNIYQDKGLLK